jgi:hypothetical protein
MMRTLARYFLIVLKFIFNYSAGFWQFFAFGALFFQLLDYLNYFDELFYFGTMHPEVDDLLICLPFMDCSFTILHTITNAFKMLYCIVIVLWLARNALMTHVFLRQTKSSFWLHIHYGVINLLFTCVIYTSPYFRGRQREKAHPTENNLTTDQSLLVAQLSYLAVTYSCRAIANLIGRCEQLLK